MNVGSGHAVDGAVLPWGPSAPSMARQLTDQLLAGHAVPAMTCRESLLVVSELVTNAVQHGEPPLGLNVTVSADRVAIEVTDGSSATPVSGGAPDADQVGGRGLDIVGQLSVEWGWRRHRSGKTVWCWLPLEPGGSRR